MENNSVNDTNCPICGENTIIVEKRSWSQVNRDRTISAFKRNIRNCLFCGYQFKEIKDGE